MTQKLPGLLSFATTWHSVLLCVLHFCKKLLGGLSLVVLSAICIASVSAMAQAEDATVTPAPDEAVNLDVPDPHALGQLLDMALATLGTPYRWGGTDLQNGVDCSGFTQSLFAALGIALPRTASAQAANTVPVAQSELQLGDLLFFSINHRRNTDHVGLYIGEGWFVHAPRRGTHVKTAHLNSRYWQKRFRSAGRVAQLAWAPSFSFSGS